MTNGKQKDGEKERKKNQENEIENFEWFPFGIIPLFCYSIYWKKKSDYSSSATGEFMLRCTSGSCQIKRHQIYEKI